MPLAGNIARDRTKTFEVGRKSGRTTNTSVVKAVFGRKPRQASR
ncbi:stress protein [Pseudomonas viciae]|uniref:Stress protein n=1 Tax=Pseudomonas viciae TaxID=2505979 RepID=A0A4P7PP50_9PSED|nr:stress protein [Pseudomonas viciae]